MERQNMPSSSEAEDILLGALMQDSSIYDSVASYINEDVLYKLYRDGTQLSIFSNNQELIYIDQFVDSQIIYEYCIEAVNDCGSSMLSCDNGFVGIGELGDINLDQTLDILDVVLLLNIILEIDIPNDDQIWLSDVNSDDLINILDIIELLNIILN